MKKVKLSLSSLKHYLGLILALAVVFTPGCQKKEVGIHPTRESITESVYASGVVKTADQYKVYASTSGILEEWLVNEGQMVRKGTPLCIVRNQTAPLNQQNAALAMAYAEANAKGEKIVELQGEIAKARQAMNNDSLLLQRFQRLFAEGAETRASLEQRELAYTFSSNNYKAALGRLKELKRQLAFNEAQAKKLFEISKAQNADFTVTALKDGQLFQWLNKQGEWVSPQAPVAVLGNPGKYQAELQVDEADIARIQKDQSVWLTLESYGGQSFEARVTEIIPLMNERSRTFTVYAQFMKAPERLFPNLNVEANIVIQQKANALTLPRNLLLQDTAVMLEDGRIVPVKLGLKDYQKAEILSGISDQDRVIPPVQ